MDIYRVKLEAMDYIFFATTERGKVYETGAYIHNYALSYAMGLARSSYFHQRQEPEYQQDLEPLNQLGIYLTPARPLEISYRLIQWNTIQEAYGFPKKERNIGYPDWGFARVIRPGSTFEFYVAIAEPTPLEKFPNLDNFLTNKGYIRLGKFMGKACLKFQKAAKVEEKQGNFDARITKERGRIEPLLLNWRDISIDPVVCDIYPSTLPTRLIANPRYENSKHYLVEFAEEDKIVLPGNMSFIARSLTPKKGRKK
ncbi:MAG: type I-D CRISPR-associated protein Cas5/Csc1 [Roseofilum sp. SBFL]|uniref:type I-D CRISPR-associated protein Cas5/Csc1 n=1 Tax=unclassified Roseofilum TaxID=2620099 RepID=UPI001B043519|nr:MULTISPECIES: type I-D CRISPR-associated protein Cas5/Csc1 [unclassified Roseofilum]MBP0013793.1 type I-D CRISPR-associated protein Cas5/Csc1 [Roseofilum sp. SID3]MBP0026245.1 type I-D CRISPR-associated protein Cas5/Csc1 [Roseofilum sp. SID2]MBP0040581.1 type I-D CRISPR-associated protein Cas5/Csc1 [Roseofilum sp. SBFL]